MTTFAGDRHKTSGMPADDRGAHTQMVGVNLAWHG